MANKFNIREMAAGDVPAAALLYSEMYREQKMFGMVMDLNHDEVENMLLSQTKSKLFLAIIAETEQGIVGFAIGSIVRYPKKYVPLDEEMPFIGFIQDVYVAPACRSAGLASQLVKELEAGFAEQGIGYVELHVLGGNDHGRKFWNAKGYQDVLQVMYKRI